MDQDWTTVTLRRRLSTKEAQSKGHTVTQHRDPEQQERARLAKLENTDEISPPKKVDPFFICPPVFFAKTKEAITMKIVYFLMLLVLEVRKKCSKYEMQMEEKQ